METPHSYIVSDSALQQPKYHHLRLQFNHLKAHFQHWIETIVSEYSLNDIKPTKIKSDNKASLHCLFSQLMNSFINSQQIINKNHCLYLRKEIEKLSSLNFLHYLESIEKLRMLIASKKTMLVQRKRTFLSLQQSIVNEKSLSQLSENPQNFYTCTAWRNRKHILRDYMSYFSQNNATTEIQELIKICEKYQTFLLSFRKKTIKYRLDFIKDSAKTSRNFFQCIGELITLGTNQLTYILTSLRNFNYRTSAEQRTSFRSSFRNSRIQIYIQMMEQHIGELRTYHHSLNRLRDMYQQQTIIGSPSKRKRENETGENPFNKLFQGNQHIQAEITRVSQILELFTVSKQNIVKLISNLIKLINSKLDTLDKRVEILRTIDRQNSKKKQFIKESKATERSSVISDEDDFLFDIERMAHELVEDILNQYNRLGQRCLLIFENSGYRKSHHQSLIEISSNFKQVSINQVKPYSQQVWLWKDYRDFKFLDSVSIVPSLKQEQIKSQYLQVQAMIANDKLKENKYEGMISLEKKYRIILYLHSDEIHLHSKQKNLDFIIPKQHLAYIEKIKKKLIIKTHNGAKFKIGHFKDEVFDEIEATIQEKYFDQKEDNPQNVVIQRIKLTDEQKKAIQQRRIRIQGQLPKVEEYIKFTERIIDTDIQTLFEVIFSEKQFCINKSYSSFFEYLHLKKLKNFNYKSTKYDPSGPSFYTGSQDPRITFENCPNFSIKQLQIDHPLPPIPFLPKICHCITDQKIYWVSNEELFYFSETKQTEPAMMSSFMTESLYSIKSVDENRTKIQLYGRVVFKEQAKMKGILKNGAEGEMKELLPTIAQQIDTSVKIYKKMISRNKAKANVEPRQIESLERDEEDQSIQNVNDKENKTKRYIIYGLVLTLILNVLLHMILR